MLIKELMTESPRVLSPSNTFGDAIELMNSGAHSCIPIVTGEKPVGIITERDVVRFTAEHLHDPESIEILMAHKLAELVTASPITVHASDTLAEAIQIKKANKIRRLLVVDEHGRLVGLVTQTAMSKAYEEMLSREKVLKVENENLSRLSSEDALMKIGNRRAMEKELDFAAALYDRYQREYAVALIDLDNFKSYNDFYGHQAGDDILRKISGRLKNEIRKTDRLFRYGGEELLLLIHDSEKCDLERLTEKLRAAVFSLGIEHSGSCHDNTATVSIGVARSQDSAWHQVVEEADQCLYRAKSEGRNRVVIFDNLRSAA